MRGTLILVLIILATPWFIGGFAESAPPTAKTDEFNGKVVLLADALEKADVKLDKDAAPFWLALQGDDGKTHPLIKDAGSRMFFKDEKLRNRPMRITGRLVGDARLLQVLTVRSLVKGQLHEPYYWCDICKIKRFEPNNCDCCGDPLEFREDPVNR